MKKRWLRAFLISLFVVGLWGLSTTNAAPPPNPVEVDPLGVSYGEYTGLGNQDVRVTVAMIINVALGLLGIVALVIIIYAGFKWMTAAGNDDQAKEARNMIFAAVIGLAVILSAYAITQFVVKSLYQATTSSVYGTY